MCELDRCYEMNRDIDVDAEEPQPLPGGAGGGTRIHDTLSPPTDKARG